VSECVLQGHLEDCDTDCCTRECGSSPWTYFGSCQVIAYQLVCVCTPKTSQVL